MASHLLLDEDQKFGMLVESLLRSIVDASHEGDGKCYYFVYLITNSKYCRDFIDIVVWNMH